MNYTVIAQAVVTLFQIKQANSIEYITGLHETDVNKPLTDNSVNKLK